MANNYLSFNGTAGYVTVPNNAALNPGTGDFTICFWIKWVRGSAERYYTLLDKVYSYPSPGWDFYIGGNSEPDIYNKIVFYVTDGTEYAFVQTTNVVPENTWTHISLTYNKSDNKAIMYTNAIPSIDYSISGIDSITNTGNLLIFRDSDFAEFVQGSLDDLRIYKSALTLEQIQAIYNGGIGTKYTQDESPTASAAWNMDEGTGTKITDAQAGLEGTFSATGVTWQSGGTPFETGGGGISMDIFDEMWE